MRQSTPPSAQGESLADTGAPGRFGPATASGARLLGTLSSLFAWPCGPDNATCGAGGLGAVMDKLIVLVLVLVLVALAAWALWRRQ